MKIQMTHNAYMAYMRENAARLYTDKGYTMADYNRDCDNVEVLPFDLARFGLSFDEGQMRVINAYFTEESESKLGNMRLMGHTLGSEYQVANTLGIEMLASGAYSGFGRSDRNRCVFEFCEGDIYLVLCENQKEYLEELGSYCKFYEVEDRVFAEGSYNLYRDGNGVDYGSFVGKAFTEKEVKDWILDFVKRYPESTFTITKDWMNGYNHSSRNVTGWFEDMLDGRLPYVEDNACIEVYFDGVLMDDVYTVMDGAEKLVESMRMYGYDDYNQDVKEDWERMGGRKNPELSFKVVPYPDKAKVQECVEGLIEDAQSRSGVSQERGRENEAEMW